MPYNFHETEKRLNDYWKEKKTFQYDFNSSKKTFSIDTPPRYASGKMHIGHAFHYSHIDIVAKYHKIKGEEVFFPLCFDVNGMPIEVNVEKKYNIRMKDYDRQEFIKLCERFADENIERMIDQFNSLGIMADPSLYYKTSSEIYRKYTQITFIRMFKNGMVYRGKHPVNWCPRCETAIAESEIVYEERDVDLNKIGFKGDGFEIIISTTRPELIPACLAVAVNPKDERYRGLVGKYVEVPLFNRKVKIIEDEDVQTDFGTGADMICSVGDKEDLKMIYRHSLEFLKSIDEQGRMTEIAGKYAGLKAKDAQQKIIEDLKSTGAFVSSDRTRHSVGTCWRCGSPLEFLQKEQWFVKSIDFKEKLKNWSRELKWHPEFMRKRMEDWIDSLSWDWVISRQRYFATPIPIWECEEGHITIAEEEQCYVNPLVDPPPVGKCQVCGKDLKGSDEVFDTWMDSSISPLFNTFYSREEKIFSRLYPMSLRPQGQDIIRTWAYYSLLRGNLLTGRNPWKEIMIDGNVMSPDGRPMHASWGNVVDPEVLLNKYGADAFRYFTASCSLGEDTPFRERDLVRGQRLVNKLYNLVNFVDFYKNKQEMDDELRPVDHWIIEELNKTIAEVDSAMASYEFDKAIRVLEEFLWHKVADNYVEIIKHRINGKKVFGNVYNVVLSTLVMLSPIFPYVTEDSYQRTFRESQGKESIFDLPFPEVKKFDKANADIGRNTVMAVSMMRDLKVKNRIPLSAEISECNIYSSSPVKIDENDVIGTLRAKKISFKERIVKERIKEIKLTPEIYSTLKEEAKGLEDFIMENPQLLAGNSIEFKGKKVDMTGIKVVKEYTSESDEVSCGEIFCVSIRK
jgi:valyl-tRNA synthetase